MELRDALKLGDDIEVLGEKNGIEIVSFNDQVKASTAAQAEGKEVCGEIKFNPNGTIARTPVKYASVNKDIYYNNRYKLEGKKLIVVIDPRALSEIRRGKIYAHQVTGYVITRKDSKLVLDKIIMVDSNDFVSNFTHKLSEAAMKEIHGLLLSYDASMTEDKMPI